MTIHRVRRLASLTVAFLLVLDAGRAADAQAVPASVPAALPASLVTALIDSRGAPVRAFPVYSVGTLPVGYPATLVPTGPVKIVGGMTTGDETIAVFVDSTRRLAAVFEQLFEQRGFRRPPGTPGSGFSSASGPYSYLCGDSGTVSVQPLPGSDRAFARVSYRPPRSAWSCQLTRQAAAADVLTLPELEPPAGAHVSRSGGGSSGSNGVNSNAEMSGANLSRVTILAHYAGQLMAAGWAAETPALGERVAAQFFEANDASGAAWEGVLMVYGDSSALTISLDMHPRRHR